MIANGDGKDAFELDEEGRRLRLEAEKAKLREALAKSTQGTAEAKASLLQSPVPAIAGAPTGTVTVGERAGAFGSWVAHETISALAEEICKGVVECVKPKDPNSEKGNRRLLVVDNRALLAGVTSARLVRDRLRRTAVQLEPLTADLQQADQNLRAAIQQLERTDAGAEGGGEGVSETETEAPAAAEERPAPSAGGAAFSSAYNLFSLLRTDYSLTAAHVTTSPSELATITAARLAAYSESSGVTVEVDGFTAANASEILTAAESVTVRRDEVRKALAGLQTRLAPVEAGLTALQARIVSLESAWAAWTSAAERSPDGGEIIAKRIDELHRLVLPQAQAIAPARATCDQVNGLLNEVDAGLGALMQAPAGGDPPLVAAVRWERLRPGVNDGIHLVLFVGIDQVSADTVTRRSLLGTSGRISFLGAAAASWLLMEPEHGVVRAGGSVRGARRLRHDLESGNSELTTIKHSGGLNRDPLHKLEAVAGLGVLAIAVLLSIVAILAALRVVLG